MKITLERLLQRKLILEANVRKRQAAYDRLKDSHSKKLLKEDKRALAVCEKAIKQRKAENGKASK